MVQIILFRLVVYIATCTLFIMFVCAQLEHRSEEQVKEVVKTQERATERTLSSLDATCRKLESIMSQMEERTAHHLPDQEAQLVYTSMYT